MEQKLERNIRLFGILKIFTKRVFLPVYTVYLAQIAGFDIKQIGLLASISAAVSFISDIPTGYFADKYGRRAALLVAPILGFFSAILYAGLPYFKWVLIAVILESLAYSFLNGAAEALMHDTLYNLKRTDDYPKIVGRAQSFGLLINTVLVAVVPLTFAINPRIPFILGSVCWVLLYLVIFKMHEPARLLISKNHSLLKDFITSMRYFISRKTVFVFVVIGVLYGFAFADGDFINLALKDLGLHASRFGLVYALGSIVGIIGGYLVHLLKKLSFRSYILLDVFILTGYLAAIGLSRNLIVVIIGFGINMGFFRLRNILYQYHMLTIFNKSEYKATLISVISAFGRPNEIWIPFAFVSAATTFGLFNGFNIIALVTTVVLVPSTFVSIKLLNQYRAKELSKI